MKSYHLSFKWQLVEKLIKAIQLQLSIFFLSLPLIVIWKLPISIASLIGNLFFTPFVIGFVLISTMIFFTEITCMPNEWLIFLLEQLNTFWHYTLQWGSKEWLVGIPLYYYPWICGMSICAVYIIMHKKWGNLLESTFLLLIMYLFFCAAGYCFKSENIYTYLKKGDAYLAISVYEGKVHVYDNGFLCKLRSPESWVEFTLVPLLLSHTGHVIIDEMHVMQYFQKNVEMVDILLDYCLVKRIHLPQVREILEYDQWKAWKKLYEKMENNSVIQENYDTYESVKKLRPYKDLK